MTRSNRMNFRLVEGKLSLSLQPAFLSFFALFFFGRHLLGFMSVEEVFFTKFLGL